MKALERPRPKQELYYIPLNTNKKYQAQNRAIGQDMIEGTGDRAKHPRDLVSYFQNV